MGWLKWSSEVIDSTAWPIAIIVVALVFRVQVNKLLKRVKGAKYGDAEVYFREELDKIEAQVSELPTTPEPSVSDDFREAPQPQAPDHQDSKRAPNDDAEVEQTTDRQDQFNEIAKLSPSAAVLTAWRDVELELRRSIMRSGLPKEEAKLPPFQITMRLYKMGIIDTPTMNVIKDLQYLRNTAAHVGEVSTIDAYRFQKLAKEAIERLQDLLAR